MDELKQLQQWQRLHEQQITRKQRQLVDGLNQPNAKPIAIVSDHFDRCHTLEDSVEQIRGEDNSESDDSLTTGRQSFSRTSYSESSPVMPGIDGNKIKTFEELLDNRLSGLKSDDSDKKDKPMPVKPFLKKGEGLKRFNPNKCPLKDETKPKSVANDNQPTKRQKKQNVRFKGYIPKKKLTKSDSAESVNYKKFMRKVIPLTTKLSKSDQTRVEVTRNTPTFVKGETEKETDLIDYLMQVYQNLSLSESDDIDDLQELLHKIESKERHIERQSLDNEKVLDSNLSGDYTSDDNSKKKVRWSPDTQVIASDDSDQEMVGSLIQPKAGAYSCKLKKQITELEEKLLTLRNTKNKMSDKNVPQTLELGESIADELSKLREQIEKLNKRIVNMEAKSYDLLSDRKNGSSQPSQQMKCIFGQRLVTTSKSKPKNISVNETPTQTTIDFPNGDKMSVSKDNTIFYSFGNGTTQTTYPDGLRITNFPNGQIEKLHKNGVKHITYANGLQRIINPDTSEEVLMTDGTVWRIHSDGSEVLEFANGDREIRTNKYKRREYRNGNIKTLYCDGTEESRYVSGRLRIKDKFGNLMVDSSIRHLNDHE